MSETDARVALRISYEQAAMLAIATADLLEAIHRTVKSDPMMSGESIIKGWSNTEYNRRMIPAMRQAGELLNDIGYGAWASGAALAAAQQEDR